LPNDLTARSDGCCNSRGGGQEAGRRLIWCDPAHHGAGGLLANVAGVGVLGLPSDIEINLDSDERLLG
jgi:hypothetical protein